MQPLNVAGVSSAMAGYNPPQPTQASTGSSSPLDGIIQAALQIGGMMAGETLGPVGGAVGSGLGTGLGELVTGQGLNAGRIGEGAAFGLMPGMLGGKLAGKAAADVADTAASDLTGDTVKAAEGTVPAVDATTTPAVNAPADNLSPTTPAPAAPEAPTTPAVPTPEPANPNAYDVGTHVNLRQYPTGTISTTKVIPPETTTAETLVTPAQPTTPATPVINPEAQPPVGNPAQPLAPQTSPTDTFTQAPAPEGSNLNTGQKVGNTIAQGALKTQVQNGGSRLTQAEADQLATNLNNDGYSNLGKAAEDSQLVTGNTGILSNGVNDHINNAEANGVSLNLGDYNNLAHKNINNTLMSGVLTPAQEKAAADTLNSVRNIVAGPGAADATDSSALTHVLPSNNLNAVRALQKASSAQKLIAQGRGASSEGASQLANLYSNMGNDLLERGFGTASGNAPISDANLENMIAQVKGANFNNAGYQQNLVNTLEAGKGGNMSLQDLRHLQANAVGYSNAASPDEISNLTNGLMSAGLNKTGITNAVLNSDPGLTLKAKAGQAVSKFFTPGGGAAEDTAGTGTTNIGGKTMSPAGKTALLAGIISALGLGANAVGTSNQASQANAELNNPQYQQTQNILNQSNALQRYLGQEGEIRSVFAPTFDTNAGEAGTIGQTLLANANQNQAARTAAANLLAARSQMGLGGILGGIAGLIPGTSQNTYRNQAANAQAQLNALGVAGSAPSVAQGGASIPSLTSMAGNVGNF